MKKTRKFLIFMLCTIAAVSGTILYMNKPLTLHADSAPEETIKGEVPEEYKSYVDAYTKYHNDKHPGAALTPQGEPIVIYGNSFDPDKSDRFAEDQRTIIIKTIDVEGNNPMYKKSKSAKAGETSLGLQDGGKIVYNVNVKTPGFYTLYMDYFTIEGYSSSIERSLLIDDKLPFEAASSFTFSRVWHDRVDKGKDGEIFNQLGMEKLDDGNFLYKKPWKEDTRGNDVKPQQVEEYTCYGSYFRDSMGYETTPYQFYFDEGEHTITLNYTKEPVVIDTIELRSVETRDTYEEYLSKLEAQHGKYDPNALQGCYTRIEGEATSHKSSPTLYPITDRSSSVTTPFSVTKTKLNTIGGDNWKVLGDWISYKVTVPKSGYYHISMRTKQNLVRGMFSTRRISLAEEEDGRIGEYQVLFEDLDAVQISYKNKWQNVTLGNENGDFLFYFEAGKTYSLKMEVTLGAYAELIAALQNEIDKLTEIYRQIISYTTTSPDADRDYQLQERFPELFYGEDDLGHFTVEGKGKFNIILDEIRNISETIKKISGGASDKTGVIDSVVVILEKFISKPRTIPQRLNTYSTNVSSLGTLLNDLREAPLQIDYIMIHTADVKLPRENENFFQSLWRSIYGFFASFFIDYSSIDETTETSDDTRTIEVWMTLGRDQANVIRNLIDTQFSGEDGYAMKHNGENIKVNLKLTGGDVLLKATLAGIGPDVALNVDSSLPVNWSLRHAVYDLTNFPDFWESVYAVPDGSIYNQEYETKYTTGYDNVYMASSLRQFQFSPNDVADELFNSEAATPAEKEARLNELKKIHGIYALPEKQIFLMMFTRDDVLEELHLNDVVPDYDKMTWDQMIDLVGALQAQQLQFFLPVNEIGATALNPIFVSLLYQNGGELYTSNNMETGLKSEAAADTFEYWTNLYTNYSFPISANFVNRFRTGEMPIGIAYYELYNTLSVFAPELKGKWSFHLIPGTEYVDENGEVKIDHTATASGTGAIILQEPAEKDPKQAEASWTFLKWWTGAEAQTQFGREMEGILGSAARHATANVKGLQGLAWPAQDLKMLMQQWSMVHEMPQVAGSYMIGREVENAFRQVVNKFYNARETLYEYALKIDLEINRKRKEFGLPLLQK